MIEQPLNFESNEDPTPVVLTDEERKKLKKSINDLKTNCSMLEYLLNEDRLTKGLAESVTTALDYSTNDVCKMLDYETTLAKREKKTLDEIRQTNIENHELRMQLGQKVSLEDCREKMKLVADAFDMWSRDHAFGYVSDIKFNDYGMIEGKIHLGAHYYQFKNVEEAMKRLRDYGFEFFEKPSDGYNFLLATEKNLELLKALYRELSEHCEIEDVVVSVDDVNTKYTRNVYREAKVRLSELSCMEPFVEEYVRRQEEEMNAKKA